MGGDTDRDSPLTKRFDLGQVRAYRLLAHALEAAARVRDVEAREADPRLGSGVCCGEGGLEPEVVELSDGRVAGGAHLAIRAGVKLADGIGRLPFSLREHPVAPRPEVAPGGAPAERSLERVAVRVDESGKRDRSRHGRRH